VKRLGIGTLALVAVLVTAPNAFAGARGDAVILENGSQQPTAGIYFGPIHIDVRSGARGRFPRGDIALGLSGGLLVRAGSPSCLRVRKHSATITFADEFYVGSDEVVTVQVREGRPDVIDVAQNVREPGDCSRLAPTGERGPLTQGDLRVIDARRPRR
jgi:hypothetical protein